MAEDLVKIGVQQSAEDILSFGPSLPVKVALRGSSKFADAVALVDTGADGCLITQELLERLGGIVSHVVRIQEANREPMDIGAIDATLLLPKGGEIDIQFGVISSMGGAHDVLIGRHLLEGGFLIVDFKLGRFEMHVDSAMFRDRKIP